MVRLGHSVLDQNQPMPRGIQRVTGRQQRIALALLLTGRLAPDDPAVDSFLQFTEQHKMNLDQCWTLTTPPPTEVSDTVPPVSLNSSETNANRSFKPEATWLMVPSAGRVAMAFMSVVAGRRDVKTTAQLIQAACKAQDAQQLRLIQVLLDPSQRLEQQATTEAGFSHLATLLYMHRLVRPGKRNATEETGNKFDASEHLKHSLGKTLRGTGGAGGVVSETSGGEVYHWSPAHRERFETVIRLSYEGTLDCPALLGVRQMDDIIAGHMAAGEFDPKRWYALYLDGQPKGVMLLNKVFGRSALELVYLGLAPAARGLGLGGRMLQVAVDLAASEQMEQVILAVDEKNRPARRLYQQFEFRVSQRKSAMIYLLPKASQKS